MKNLQPALWSSLPGPHDITRVELPNGITILARSNFNSPSMVVNGYLPAGSLFDPAEKLGLAYFTALALMRGTQARNFQEIYNALESAGASLGFSASVHNLTFGGRCLSEDLPLLMELTAQSLRQAVFPADQVERLRAQILTGLAIRAQDTGDQASLAFDRALFGNHPYGQPEDGYIETIQNISRQDLADFHARYYSPRGMVIVAVGGMDAQEAVAEITQVVAEWQNGSPVEQPVLPEIHPLSASFRQHIALDGKTQTDLVMGTLGPRRSSPDYMAASLGNSVLGQFGMMGRIGDVVREQAGLAYYASTSLNAWIESGSWEVTAGVNPANLQRAIDLIIEEIKRFIAEPVTPEELADSQASFIGRLPLSLESNGGVAGSLLNLERFQLGLDYIQRYPALIQAVTPRQVLETARRYLDPERLAIISSGPAA